MATDDLLHGQDSKTAQEEAEEDDYMTMTFAEEPTAPKFESSIQKQARKRREGEIKARVKSNAEVEADERKARDETMATSMMTDKSNKGLKLMEKLGFKGDSLGKRDRSEDGDVSKGVGRTDPIALEMKEDRGGIGVDAIKKRKVREAMEGEAKRVKAEESDYRERIARERMERKLEGQLKGAMKVAEGLDEDKVPKKLEQSEDGQDREERPDVSSHSDDVREGGVETNEGEKPPKAQGKRLKDINILYRPLAKDRLERDWHHHQKQELNKRLESSSSTRRPAYIDPDEQDPEYKIAFGNGEKGEDDILELEDLDAEDQELDEFNALPLEERLMKLVKHMREKHWYCFWCKTRFDDESMEGCPGLTEDDH